MTVLSVLHNARTVVARTVELHPGERWPKVVLGQLDVELEKLRRGPITVDMSVDDDSLHMIEEPPSPHAFSPAEAQNANGPCSVCGKRASEHSPVAPEPAPSQLTDLIASRDHWRSIAEDAVTETQILAQENRNISERLGRATPDDLRAAGWAVAAHYDHGQNTVWLLTRCDRAVWGESMYDAVALDQIRHQVLTGTASSRRWHTPEENAAPETGAREELRGPAQAYPDPERWPFGRGDAPDTSESEPEPEPCDMCHPSHYGLMWRSDIDRFVQCTGAAHVNG